MNSVEAFRNLKEVLGYEDQIPEGYKTADELAQEIGKHRNNVKKFLDKGVTAGMLDSVRVKRGSVIATYYKFNENI